MTLLPAGKAVSRYLSERFDEGCIQYPRRVVKVWCCKGAHPYCSGANIVLQTEKDWTTDARFWKTNAKLSKIVSGGKANRKDVLARLSEQDVFKLKSLSHIEPEYSCRRTMGTAWDGLKPTSPGRGWQCEILASCMMQLGWGYTKPSHMYNCDTNGGRFLRKALIFVRPYTLQGSSKPSSCTDRWIAKHNAGLVEVWSIKKGINHKAIMGMFQKTALNSKPAVKRPVSPGDNAKQKVRKTVGKRQRIRPC